MFNNVNTHRCFIMSMMYIRNLVDLHLKYYTDAHDVDEDSTTIVHHSGLWSNATAVGITYRYMSIAPSHASSYIASNQKNIHK